MTKFCFNILTKLWARRSIRLFYYGKDLRSKLFLLMQRWKIADVFASNILYFHKRREDLFIYLFNSVLRACKSVLFIDC